MKNFSIFMNEKFHENDKNMSKKDFFFLLFAFCPKELNIVLE